MGITDEVKQRTDIVEVIGQYTTLTKSGRNLRALCPFHTETRPSFFVYPEQQSWHCFGACNTGGDVFSFIMKKEGMDFGEALRFLAERAGITVPSRSAQDVKKEEKDRLYRINETAAKYYYHLLMESTAGEIARKYLQARGISPETITKFNLGYSLNKWEALKAYMLEQGYSESHLLEAGLIIESENGKTHDRFRNRLMFPIHDSRGYITGFGARVLDDSLPKYVNSPQTTVFDKSGTLYGIHLSSDGIKKQDMAVIVEGYMDVLTAHQNGFNNVVASMGTALTERHLGTLKRLTRNIALALDADSAGDEATLRSVGYENTLDAEVKVVMIPRGKDPDDVIREDRQNWQDLVQEALPVMDYFFDSVTSKLNLLTARDKSVTVNRLLPVISEISDSTRQNHYLNILSRLTGIRYSRLEDTLKIHLAKKKSKKATGNSIDHDIKPVLSSPLEEYCLALLLQYPELKSSTDSLLPEYLQNSENHEIYINWQIADDIQSLKESVDPSIWAKIDTLVNMKLISTQIENRYKDCLLRLREEYLRNLEIKREAIFALESEVGGTAAELAKLEEQGIDVSTQLGNIFAQKARASRRMRNDH